MKNLRKVILSVMVMLLLVAVSSLVFATNDGIEIIGNTNVDDGNILDITDTNTTQTPATNTPAPLNTVNTTNTSTYNNTTNLPQTGAGDYTMILIIGAFAVAAVYAYKKISDYRDI